MATPQLHRFFGRPTRLKASLAVALLFGVFAVMSSAAWAQDATSAAGQTQAGDQTSLVAPIGPGDILNLNVIGQPDLSHQYQVDANGDIELLYVGKIHVSGLTPDQATTTVTNALGTIYVDPQVTLTRASMGGSSVTVTGAVEKQGTVLTRRDAHLNDVIQQAVPSADADLSKIQITRGLPGQQHTTLTEDLSSFLSSGAIDDNPSLQDGDVIFVPSKTPVSYSVSVVGAVNKPGRFDVPPGSTVYDLIKLAGGLDDSADRTNIYVQPIGSLDRRSFNYDKARVSPEDANLNPVLNDGDKVVVSEVTNVPVFSITGAVLKPGQYPINGKLSLTDAEGLAGGIQNRAKVNLITITRETGAGAQVIKLNAENPQIAANFQLQPGDNIYIPQGHEPYHVDPLTVIGTLLTIFVLFH